MAEPHTYIDPESSCLVLAPHLVYPPQTGANILIDRRWSAFSNYVRQVDIIAAHEIVRYEGGRETARTPYRNKHRSKVAAAMRTLLRRSHYLREKFVTAAFSAQARRALSDSSYDVVVGSFVYTIPLLANDSSGRDRVYLVESHNDEVKWYRTLRTSQSNPIIHAASRQSERWSTGLLQSLSVSNMFFLHLTETDAEGFEDIVPGHSFSVAPIGVSIPDQTLTAHEPNATVRLLFVGSLGVQMNADALAFFGNTYYPILKAHLGEQLSIDVVGNSPSDTVRRMCQTYGWQLHPNASDDLLHELLHRASFTLLPFEYATGAKLKLLESLAHGVPFLATSHVQAQLDSIPTSCLLADDPGAWLEHVKMIRERGHSVEDRLALVEIARRHSWKASAGRVFNYLVSG